MARRLIPIVGLALVAAACSDEVRAFDPSIIPAAITEEVGASGIDTIDCGDLGTFDPILGGALDCTGVLNGDPVELAVEVAPAVDGQIDLATEVVTPLFDVATAEAGAAARLDVELGGSPVVECAERLVVVEPGRRIACRVTADGGTAGPIDQAITIVIVDADANWEVDLTG